MSGGRDALSPVTVPHVCATPPCPKDGSGDFGMLLGWFCPLSSWPKGQLLLLVVFEPYQNSVAMIGSPWGGPSGWHLWEWGRDAGSRDADARIGLGMLVLGVPALIRNASIGGTGTKSGILVPVRASWVFQSRVLW